MNDLSVEARALLDISRNADDPSREDRLRVQRGLAAAIGGGAAIASTAGTASGASTGTTSATATALTVAGTGVGKIATWALLGVAAGLVSVGALVGVSRLPTAARPGVSATVPTAVVEPQHGIASAAPPEAPTAAAAPTTAEPEQPRVVVPPTPAPHLAPHPLPTSSLATETTLLEAARAALGKGDARGALTLLDEHEREFPNGTLTEERLASKVFALCDLGRRAEAATTAAELLQRAPSSPLRARVLDSCAFTR